MKKLAHFIIIIVSAAFACAAVRATPTAPIAASPSAIAHIWATEGGD
ncbi:MAG: hypothetical protein HN413_03915, partial [Chloroflexi bacterium]|nr:hypothetical protein [Chloroflexota bacterium]